MNIANTNSFIKFFDIRKGRLHRLDFLIFSFGIFTLSDLLDFLHFQLGGVISVLMIPLSILFFYLCALLNVKRLRDINLSGWFYLPMLLITVVLMNDVSDYFLNPFTFIMTSILLLIFLCLVFIPPQDKNNRFGDHVLSFFYRTPPLDFYKGKKELPIAVFKTSAKSIFLLAIGIMFAMIAVMLPMFYGFFFLDNNFRSLPDPLEVLAITAFSLFFLLVLMVIPSLILIRKTPVKLYEEGIEGYNLYSIAKGWCRWEEIKHVKIKKSFFLIKLIQLQDEKGEELFSILYEGLDNFDEFKNQVIRITQKENPFNQFLKNHSSIF